VTDARRHARVLVADDHPPTRAGIRLALERAGYAVCAETGDAETAVHEARRQRPDVCLLDVRMPGNGIAAARQIADELPGTVVVMLTVSEADDDLLDSLRAGAAGYLLKDIQPESLAKALAGVLAGEAALPRSLTARVVAEVRDRTRRRLPLPIPGRRRVELTPREWEVLDLLRQGATTRDMAERLFVAPATVRSHVASILTKLEVPDRRAALRLLDDGHSG
jgi:DNA-binding NarL/FixJ family response regulator